MFLLLPTSIVSKSCSKKFSLYNVGLSTSAHTKGEELLISAFAHPIIEDPIEIYIHNMFNYLYRFPFQFVRGA